MDKDVWKKRGKSYGKISKNLSIFYQWDFLRKAGISAYPFSFSQSYKTPLFHHFNTPITTTAKKFLISNLNFKFQK